MSRRVPLARKLGRAREVRHLTAIRASVHEIEFSFGMTDKEQISREFGPATLKDHLQVHKRAVLPIIQPRPFGPAAALHADARHEKPHRLDRRNAIRHTEKVQAGINCRPCLYLLLTHMNPLHFRDQKESSHFDSRCTEAAVGHSAVNHHRHRIMSHNDIPWTEGTPRESRRGSRDWMNASCSCIQGKCV